MSRIGQAQPTVTDVVAPSSTASPSTGTTTTAVQSTSTIFFPTGSEVVDKNSAALPSSSRPISNTGASSDGFDLNANARSVGTVRGSKGSFAITGQSVQAVIVPDVHTVRQGDTLWDLCDHYVGNPWDWPRIWSYNPEIRNPNWIYPGDQIRMRSADQMGLTPLRQSAMLRGGGKGTGTDGITSTGSGLWGASPRVPKDTVFLRNEAYIDDPEQDVLGEVVGANEEQMLLSQGNHVYLDLKPNVSLKVGQQLTLFEHSRKPEAVDGARQPSGEIVVIKGTIRVSEFDEKKHVAKAEIIECNDVIERGVKTGSIGRRYVVVPPKASAVTVWARLLTGVYPHVYYGQQQLVFIDRGTEDKLEAGNRLLIIRRGDTWRKSLQTTSRHTSGYRLRIDSPKPTDAQPVELKRDEDEFPEEVIGELRIIHVRKWSSLALVTSAQRELVVGDRAVAREGY
jgi:hypothetical protein